jgi:serine/threonine-protein kinase
VPPWLADIITRLLAKSPAERIQSASEVADLLKQWLAHLAQPTLILPPKFVAPPKAQKPSEMRSRRWLAALGLAGAVLAGGFIGVALSGYFDPGPTVSTRGDVSPHQSAPSLAAPVPAVEPPSPSAVSAPPLDLPRESEFAAELAQAAEATYALEVESGSAVSPGQSIAAELADLESRTTWLETELSQVMKLPAPEPIDPEQPIPDAVPRLTEPSRSER